MTLRDLSIDFRESSIDLRVQVAELKISVVPSIISSESSPRRMSVLLFMVFLTASQIKTVHPDSKNIENKFLRLLMRII